MFPPCMEAEACLDLNKTKAYPQTKGMCECFHKTILQEFYQVAFRKKIYSTLEELQNDLDNGVYYYNYERTHQGKMCCGLTPKDCVSNPAMRRARGF